MEEDIREIIAQVCHEANRAWCEAHEDSSQAPWDEAPEWQRQSSVDGVKFLLETPDAGPEACHERWLYHKQRDGWQWGSEKDPEKKLHPCIMPYGGLPPEQQMKDRIFHGIVHAMGFASG